MPKVRVLAKSFIGNRLVEPGEVIDYDGPPGAHLEPVEEAAHEAAEPKVEPPEDDRPRRRGRPPKVEPDDPAT